MIRLLFLFTSWTTIHSSLNQCLESHETEFTNESPDYEVFEDRSVDKYNSENSNSLSASNYELENNMIKFVPIIVLQRHNHIRLSYNFPPLRLSAKLNNLCEMYAKKHASGDTSVMLDYLSEYGINVHYGIRSLSNPNYVMNFWIDESCFYDPGNSDEENMIKMPHLSQILWKDTEAIGVCVALIDYCIADTFLLYVLYDPPGNAVKDFRKNFPPLKASLGTIPYQHPFVMLLNFYLLRKLRSC